MKNLIAITLFWCCCTAVAFGQSQYAIKGSVTDTASKTALDGATVTVVNAKDSILQKFTYTSKGVFSIANLKPGNYLLLVSYADYADYSEPFKLDAAKPTHDFGKLALVSKAMLLNEVIIKSKAVAMKIKGDTTVFNAAAFITQKNAKVDDLLKQLPGMKVNQDGSIVFQGEQVGKLLVDGEEFFSDDPVLVSKTVRADMVAHVQVYNDKSTQAKLTGVDDGQKVTTINLQLREDKKRGIFGKVEASYGTRDFYVGQAMFSKFSPKEKFSAYGSTSNNGRIGLSSADASKFGNSGGGIVDFSGRGGVRGLPVSRDAGAHYDTKWNKDKQSINANYKLSTLENDVLANTITQNNLPGNFNRVERDQKTHNFSVSHTPDFTLNNTIDSTSSINLQFNSRFGSTDNNSIQNSFTYRPDGTLQNSNDNRNSTKGNNSFAVGYVRYVKRLKKQGRSLSVNFNGNMNTYSSEGYLNSALRTYDAQGALLKDTLTDQFKDNANDYKNLSINVSFTEQLSKPLSLTLGYGRNLNVSNNKVLSYNKLAGGGAYDVLDTDFSNSFRTSSSSGTYIFSLWYRKGVFSANINNTLADNSFKQVDKLLDTMLVRKFLNWSPNAYVTYQLSKAASINFNYYGYTSQPSITQIQPLRQNADLLNITIGNPSLKPEFSSNYSLYYRIYQGSANRGMNIRVNYGNRVNAILRNQFTANGINTFQYTNLEGYTPFTWGANIDLYGNVTKAFVQVSPSFAVNGNTFYNYVNGQFNTSKTVEYRPSISVSKNTDKYNVYFNFGFNYSTNTTTIQPIPNNSRGYNATLNLYTKLPFGFYVGEECNYEFNGKNQVFADDFRRVLLRAYLGRNFFDENLKVSVSGNDLLNQNTGYYRSGYQGSFTEERYNTVRRYFMVSVSWDFSKFGKSPQKQQP